MPTLANAIARTTIGDGRDYRIINPVNSDHELIAERIGAQISRTIQGTPINRPTGGQYDEDGNLWIGQYAEQFRRLNSSLEVDFTPDIALLEPQSSDGTRYHQDVSITTDGSKLILAASYARHCVRVYNRDTGELISTIGEPNIRGDIADNRLNLPHSAIRLANGNIAVSSSQGDGPNTTGNRGSISIWDVSTPTATLVQAVMEGGDDFLSAVGTNKIFRPMKIMWAQDGNVLISEFQRQRILRVCLLYTSPSPRDS